MKDIDEIRRENIKALELESGSPTMLAKMVGMSLAQYLNLRDGAKDSKTGKPRGMRKETARKFEDAGRKPHGWLDKENAITPLENKPTEQHQQLARFSAAFILAHLFRASLLLFVSRCAKLHTSQQ